MILLKVLKGDSYFFLQKQLSPEFSRSLTAGQGCLLIPSVGITRKNRWPVRFLAWAAVVFLALGPALAPVLQSAPKNGWLEICTAYGAMKIAVSGDQFSGAGKPAPVKKASAHCPFCNLRQFQLLALAPAAIALPEPPALVFYAATDTQQRLAALYNSSPYISRAPPSA